MLKLGKIMLSDFLVSNILENARIEYDIFLSDKDIEKIFNKNVFVLTKHGIMIIRT